MQNPKIIEFIKFINRLPIPTEKRSVFVEEYTSNLRKEEMVDIKHKKYFETEILPRVRDPMLDLPLTMPLLIRS
jgi:hypothetical protein